MSTSEIISIILLTGLLWSCNKTPNTCINIDTEPAPIVNATYSFKSCSEAESAKWTWNETVLHDSELSIIPTNAGVEEIDLELCDKKCNETIVSIAVNYLTICRINIDSISGIDTLHTSNINMRFLIQDSIYAISKKAKYRGEMELTFEPNSSQNQFVIDHHLPLSMRLLSEYKLHNLSGNPYYKDQWEFSPNKSDIQFDNLVNQYVFNNSDISIYMSILFCLINPEDYP
jgi:hypothetical protein